jgi:succinate-semialdehyde dehydrogenase/glutarate-semialdehyde dehydrogenase
MDDAVAKGVMARMLNAGQSCIAAKRYLVDEAVSEIFTRRIMESLMNLRMGDPMDPATEIGPLSSAGQAGEVERQVDESLVAGAGIVCGGKRNGAFYEPTLLVNVTPEMPVFKEEVFGPVIPVTTFSTIEEAIRLANQSPFGLGVSIFTKNVEAVAAYIPLFEDGAVFINSMVKSDPRLPFGGTKHSGFGRELSYHGIREFVNIKTVFISD